MDEITRGILTEAFALADQGKADFDRWQVQYERCKRQQPTIIRKQYLGDQPDLSTPAAPSPVAQFMDAQTQKAWDTWLWAHLGNLMELIGAETGQIRREQNDVLQNQLDDLRAELHALRYEIKQLREQ